ncbi:MAG: sulfite exporter TauE/SafE family protein [Oligoflexia bacterium]|nr:sulfite exporter TauE/SafE family protein [Oligoflexia bacterium]
MQSSLLAQIFASFGAGILASLSPCIYPLLPITLGFFTAKSESGRKLEIFGFVFGQMIVFSALGIFAVTAGQALGMSAESPVVQITIGLILILFGVVTITPKLSNMLSQTLSRIKLPLPKIAQNKISNKIKAMPILSALFLGMGSALLISPCTTPILSGVLTMIATNETFSRGILLMVCYSAGLSSIILLIGVGILSLKKIPRSGNWLLWMHRLGAVALVAAGFYYLYLGIIK